MGLGPRLEKEPRATDTTSTAPEDEAPYLERDLLLKPSICSLLFAVGNAASDWIKCLTPLIPFPSAGSERGSMNSGSKTTVFWGKGIFFYLGFEAPSVP